MSRDIEKKGLGGAGRELGAPASTQREASGARRDASGAKGTHDALGVGREAKASSGPDARAPKKRSRIVLVLAAMGPGLVSAMAGNDAGGISTYSSCGSLFGFSTLWVIPIMMVLLIIVQEAAGRMGAQTGKGLASLIREKFGLRPAAIAMLALLVANTATTFSEFAGVAAALELFGISKYVSVPIAALAVWLLVTGGSYRRVERVFLVISCVFATYVVAGVLAQPDWGAAVGSTFLPAPVASSSYFSLVIATVGATIAPWMIFFTQSNVVEKGSTTRELPFVRIDAITGAVVSCVVAWFIILTTGAVLYPQGIEIVDAADAAMALGPVAGEFSTALFGAGLLGASLLAACILPLTTAEVVCEAFGWERSVSSSWREAPIFNGLFTAIVVVSAVIVLIPDLNLMGMMLLSQFINGILLPVILVFVLLILKDRRIMGKHANGRVLNFLIKLAIVAIVALTVATFVLQANGCGKGARINSTAGVGLVPTRTATSKTYLLV